MGCSSIVELEVGWGGIARGPAACFHSRSFDAVRLCCSPSKNVVKSFQMSDISLILRFKKPSSFRTLDLGLCNPQFQWDLPSLLFPHSNSRGILIPSTRCAPSYTSPHIAFQPCIRQSSIVALKISQRSFRNRSTHSKQMR